MDERVERWWLRSPEADLGDPAGRPGPTDRVGPADSADRPAPAAGPREPADDSRAARRAHREALVRDPVLPELSTEVRPAMAVAAAAYALLVALAGVVGLLATAFAVLWAGIVLAWGWPRLLGSSSRFGSTIGIAIGGVLCPAAVVVAGDEPRLRHVPAAIAVALVAMFFHQLLRKDGRPRLTESVSVTAAGLGVVAVAVLLVPLPALEHGGVGVAAGALGVAATAWVDLLIPRESLRRFVAPAAGVIGALAGLLAALVGQADLLVCAGIGLVAALLALTLRRVLSPLPTITSIRGQVAAGVASVCITGVSTHVLTRLFL